MVKHAVCHCYALIHHLIEKRRWVQIRSFLIKTVWIKHTTHILLAVQCIMVAWGYIERMERLFFNASELNCFPSTLTNQVQTPPRDVTINVSDIYFLILVRLVFSPPRSFLSTFLFILGIIKRTWRHSQHFLHYTIPSMFRVFHNAK